MFKEAKETKEKKLPFTEILYVRRDIQFYGMYYDKPILLGESVLDDAVQVEDEPQEIAIYQLIRIAKFTKTTVEVKTLTEIK